jgi:hypothetical protein
MAAFPNHEFGVRSCANVSGRACDAGWFREVPPTAGSSLRVRNLRGMLVIRETALTIVLSISAGLVVQKFRGLAPCQSGLQPEQPAHFQHHPAQHEVSNASQPGQISPGVARGSFAGRRVLLMGDQGIRGDLTVEGQSVPPQGFIASKLVVSTNYFRTLEIPLRLSRESEERDSAQAAPVPQALNCATNSPSGIAAS